MEETLIQLLQHPIITEALASIKTLNDDYTQLAVDVGILKMQMESIVYWGRYLGMAIGGILIAQFVQIWQIKKNNKK